VENLLAKTRLQNASVDVANTAPPNTGDDLLRDLTRFLHTRCGKPFSPPPRFSSVISRREPEAQTLYISL